MKILHIGDIHLGSALGSISRNPELERVLGALVHLAQEEHVEAALLAGDIFDNGSPSNESMKLYFDFLDQLQKVGCRQVVVISGNHDSPTFLAAPQLVLEKVGIQVVATVDQEHLEREVVTLGDAENPAAYVCAVPYLRPGDVRGLIPDGEDSTAAARAFEQGIAEHYRQVLAKAQELRGDRNVPIIGMGHFYAKGSSLASKDDEHTVGNLKMVRVEDFGEGYDYLALGHIHKPQCVPGHKNWRYAGSVIPMDVRERNYAPEVVVLDTADLTNYRTCELPYDCYDRMAVVKSDSVDELRNELQRLSDEGKAVWVKPIYTGQKHQPNWSIQLQQLFRDSKLRFVRPEEKSTTPPPPPPPPIDEATPEQIFLDTLDRQEPSIDDASRERYLELFRQAQEEALDPSVRREAVGKAAGEQLRFRRLFIKNVNSLYGENLINFDDPAFRQGVFLISGDTGAGKSSILDAICLALYGQTPRSGELSENFNPVISSGEQELMAELTFTLGGTEYRASFQQKRTRDGSKNPFSGKTHVLCKAGKAMNLTPGQVSKKITELIGMDLSQFTRCVLLAQGGFDAFLKAGTDLRAAILMKITGTDVCNKIGVKINEKFSQIEKIYENQETALSVLGTLKPEERAELEEKHREALAKQDTVTKNLKSCEKCETIFQEIDMANGKVQEAAKQLAQANEDLVASEPLRKELEDAHRAQNCQPEYEAHAQNLRSRQTLTEDLQRLKDAQGGLDTAVETAQATQKTASDEYSRMLQEQEQKKTLFDEVRALDVQVATLDQQIEAAKTELQNAKNALQTAQSQFAEATKAWKNAQTSAAEATVYLEEHSADKALEGNARTWELRRATLVMAEQTAEQLQIDVARLEKKLKTSRERQAKHRGELARFSAEREAQQKKIDEQRKLQAGLLDGVANLGELRELEVSARKLRDFFTGKIQRSSFLKQGEACPLCGSIQHPYCEGEEPPKSDFDHSAEELKKRVTDYEGCEEAIQTAMSAQNQAEREMATVTAQLQAADKETQENEQNCTERQQELKKQQEAVTRDAQSLAGELETALQVTWTDHLALPQELEQRIRKFQEAQATANQLAEKQQVFQTAKASYEGRREPLEKAVNVAQTKVNDLNAELGQLRQTRQEKFGGAQVDEEEESLAKKVQAAHQASENANGELSVAKTNLANNQENQKNLNDRLQALASPLAETATALSDKLQAFGFADVAEFEAKRREATRVQELTEKLQQLSGVMTQAKTALDERKATLAEWQQKLPADASREANLKQLTALQEEKTAVQSTLNDLGARLQGDDLNREKREKLVAEHRQLEVQHNDWTFLNDKFGSKKDLNRFGRLAQGYTFRRLLFFANNLNFPALNNHFTLETDAIDPLELNVRDHFRGNQVRTSKNLSGGESFEVSLALALGLAEMSASSQNARLGNVLIDEGFGSLDSKSLDGALDMLTQLNTTGNKLVGIISHVERLQECIPAQIQVVNSNGMGKLVGAGVGSLSDARQWSKANPIPKRDK